ncbi:MAG: MFS transporter [Clostridiales bacterium]|nr:MFS transporter [Clostridiales bacterium]
MKLDRKKMLLMWTILIIALVQMPALALPPAINLIQSQVFPEHTLAEVQTALAWTNLVSPVMSIIVAYFINRGIFTKKGVVVVGLLLLSLTGVLAIFYHEEFWSLSLLSVVLGMATGCFMTNAFGLLFDNFDDRERQLIAGYQTSCINLGGISMGLLGGVLATAIWYGGYLILLIGLPIAILAFFTVPNYTSPSARFSGENTEKSRLNPRIFYYAVLTLVFMMIYGVGGANISPHIKQSIPNVNDAAMAGVAVAIQMGGGVVSGFFFGKLSEKLKDMILPVACATVFVGFMLISFFASSLVLVFIGIFIAGMSLSLMLPRCIFAVSTLVDKSTSATATVIISSVAPSFGGLLSPQVFTRLESAFFGDATITRYIVAACTALVLALVITVLTLSRGKKENTARA